MSFLEIAKETVKKIEKDSSSFTWKDFYPDLDESEWEFTYNRDGSLLGRKVQGEMVGLTDFYIPIQRLRGGPPNKANSGGLSREEASGKRRADVFRGIQKQTTDHKGRTMTPSAEEGIPAVQ